MYRNFLRLIKDLLPSFLPIPYFYKAKLKLMVLPKHHWTQYLQKSYEKETFTKIRNIFNNYKISNVWDIGANAGMYSVYIAKKYDCCIHAFEPTKKYFNILKRNTYFFKNVYSHNFGIGSIKNKKRIVLTDEPGSNYISNNEFKIEESNIEICELKSI